MKILCLFALLPPLSAFVIPNGVERKSSLFASTQNHVETGIESPISRRKVFQISGAAVTVTSLLQVFQPSPADASEIKSVLVAGATGQTGSRIYDILRKSDSSVVGGVRNVAKAKLPGTLAHVDVVEDSLETLTDTLKGVDGLIIACGMNPTKNLFRMSAAAHEVDNLGTCKLIDAAKMAGVQKVVLLSSILTNGRAWGQQDAPGFVATNAFGGALDEKLAAELHLRASGLDYTIVRPGGLKSGKPAGALSVRAEDTLNSGEISRDLVASVCVAALTDPKASNKVLEIIEDEGVPPKVFNGLVM